MPLLYLYVKRTAKGGPALDKNYVRNDEAGIVRTKTAKEVRRFVFCRAYKRSLSHS